MDRWWDGDPTTNLALVSGSDPQMGVSVAVLGFHAIAKSELDRLATETLVDRRRIEEAYDRVDLGPVRKAVEAATTDVYGPVAAAKYADLVVEDWRSRAQEASSRLTGALVAKGIPWPRAVARTSSVAGVPLTHLGRYATVVANPALDPLSVSDAADRVLMEYAAQRGQLEMPGTVEISKERMRMRAREREEVKDPDFERAHARDALGQFAAMNEGGEAKEREEQEKRKAARMARRARREKRERRAERELQEAQAKENAPAQREGREGAQRESGQEPGAQRGGAQREVEAQRMTQRFGGGVDWDNMTSMAAKDVPPVGELLHPVWVDEPLYLVVTSHMTHMGRMNVVSDMAFQKGHARKLAAHINRTDQSNPSVSLLRFASGGATVWGRELFQKKEGDDKFEGIGFRLYTQGNLADNLQVGSKNIEQGFTVMGRSTASEKEVPIYETILLKADETGRMRMRTRKREQVKDPEFEQQHARNRLGQFASMNQEGGDARAQQVERRKKRMERRARREQREEVERQEAVARQLQNETPAERAQRREAQAQRETQAQRGAQRERGQQRGAQRERMGGQPNSHWLAFVKMGMENGTSTRVNDFSGYALASYGFGLSGEAGRPYLQELAEGSTVALNDVLVSEMDRQNADKTIEHIQEKYKWLDNPPMTPSVSHLFEYPSDKELLYMHAAHDLGLSLYIGGESKKTPAIYSDVKGAAAMTLGISLDEMREKYLSREKYDRDPIAVNDIWEESEPFEGLFTPPTNRMAIMRDPDQSPGPEPQLLVSRNETASGGDVHDHKYVAIVHPRVQKLGHLIHEMTHYDDDPHDQVNRINAAKELMRLYDPNGRSQTMQQLISTALKEENIRVEQLDQDTKMELVADSLRDRKHPAVRLDNVDILRFW